MFKFAAFSEHAHSVDHFTLWLTILCVSVCFILFGLTTYFCWKFHASRDVKPQDIQNSTLEISWTVTTTVIFLGIFAWATVLYRRQVMPPAQVDHEVFVVGKRWMWKFYHANGFTEVNDLHLPQGKTVRLTMISQDVIHSMYLPGMRTKQDLLPGTYTTLVLRPNAQGESSLYCAEYCGTEHSRMKGRALVVPERDYQELLHTSPLRLKGEEVFRAQKCLSCHDTQGVRAPTLTQMSALSPSEIRSAIYTPALDMKPGYPTTMPSYQKVLTEEDIVALIKFIQQARLP